MQDYRTRPFEDVREHPVPGRQVMGRVQLVGGGQNEKKEMDIKVGDRIVALTPYGGNARYISIPVQSAILIPSHLRRFDIVCLVESYMSAYQMLNLGKKNRAGANIFIIGSSDPVGLAMVEMATRGGAIVYATSERCYRRNVTQLGATWLPNDPRAFSKLRGKMDVVIDTLCLDGYKSSHEALSLHGKLICTSNPPKHDDGSIFERMDRSWSKLCANCIWSNVRFYDVHKSFQDDRQMFEQDFRDLLCKLRNGNIRPKIAGQICLNQVPESQRLMEKGLPNGTVIVLPWKKLDTTQHVPLEFVH
jgi:NADPH:quinone reductase-like Zn-dependent oxidoreductase